MNSEIQSAVEAGKLTTAAARALEKLQPGTYCVHKSWGFGEIESVNFLVHQMTINFKGKKAHPMQLQYAAESLQPIPSEHILAQKASDLSGIKTRAKKDPAALMRQILQSLGGKATTDQVAQVLVPDIFSEAEFKRWIEATKKDLRTDGHFIIPAKKTEAFELREDAISHADEYLAGFQNARQLKAQQGALDQILKNLEEFKDPVSQLSAIVTSCEDIARKNLRLNTAEALQFLLTRDELLERVPGLSKGVNAHAVAQILRDEERNLPELLGKIPAVKQKQVISGLPEAFGEDWPRKALEILMRGNTRVVGEIAQLLQEKGQTEALSTGLDHAIRDHSISSEVLCWLCKEREGAFATLMNLRLFSAIIGALERDQFRETKRDRKLHDLLMNDRELVADLLVDASAEELRDVMRKLMLTPVFEELNKRSLLGRIIKLHPDLQSMVSGESGEKQEALIVSWASLEKRKAELDEIIKKKIPENTKEIGIARSYGDLRENFEFKAAKEMQRVLMRRRAEMERDVSIARGTDFANPDLTQVSIGTTVKLRDLSTGSFDTYSVLGAWDGDPDRNIISYQTAIGQAILGHKPGEHVTIPTETGARQAEIVSVEAYQPAV